MPNGIANPEKKKCYCNSRDTEIYPPKNYGIISDES